MPTQKPRACKKNKAKYVWWSNDGTCDGPRKWVEDYTCGREFFGMMLLCEECTIQPGLIW